MARSIWSGSIGFGLVVIPVKLFTAVRRKSVHFHLLHPDDRVRLRQKLECPADGEEVSRKDAVRGYEISPDRYVVVKDEEIQSLKPEARRTIDILDFVGLGEIDPMHYEQPYYLLPDPQAGKAYSLLLEAMTRAEKVGIAKFVMHSKEYLAALRPMEKILCLETMLFADEIVPVDEIGPPESAQKLDEREVKTALQLIDALSAPWTPEKYRDEYREAVLDLIERKAEGKEIAVQPEPQARRGKVVDLMSALEASLSRVKGGKKRKRKKTA